MNTNYCLEALEILLDEKCLPERYYPLIPFRDKLVAGFHALHCKTRDDAAALSDEAIAETGLKDEEIIRLLRKFFTLYDPNPQKFRELKKAALDPEEQHAYNELYYLPGVKQIRASIYFRAGYRSLADFVSTTVDEVLERTGRVISEYGLSCTVPLPKEVRTHIAVAKAFLWNSDAQRDRIIKSPVINGIHHFSMKCSSPEEAAEVVRFYCDILGMTIAKKWEQGFMLDSGNGCIEVFTNANGIKSLGAIRHIAFETESADDCVRAVREAGYTVFLEPKDISVPFRARIAFCFGPLGEQIEFFQLLQ